MRVIIDSREPWPHAWTDDWTGVDLERRTLPTGDLATANGAVVIERKTASDLLRCVGRDRARFERELDRAGALSSFVIVVEASLAQVLNPYHRLRSQVHPSAILGSIAAWTRRGIPIVFAGDLKHASLFALRYLQQEAVKAEGQDSTPPDQNAPTVILERCANPAFVVSPCKTQN